MDNGLSHITFIVRDLDKMEKILVTILNAQKIYDSNDKNFSLSKERFYDIGGVWVAIMEGEPLPTKTYNHVAFKMAETDYDEKLKRIKALGLKIKEDRPRIQGEGHSIYFYDHDNHMFELHSGSLEERISSYAQHEN